MTPLQHGSDPYFKASSAEDLDEIEEGTLVRFSYSGRRQVTDLEILHHSGGRFVGHIRFIDPHRAFGFVHCSALASHFSTDVFVGERDLSDFSLGDRVRFSLAVSSRALPQATKMVAITEQSSICMNVVQYNM